MMFAPPIVSPSNSQEAAQPNPSNQASQRHPWISKLQSGVELSATEWHNVAQNKNEYPLLEDNTDTKGMVRCIGMVQDMLDANYCCSEPSADAASVLQNCRLVEQTPLVIAPIPFCTQWFRQQVLMNSKEDTHRDKRMRVDHKQDADAMEMDHDSSTAQGTQDSFMEGGCPSHQKSSPALSYFYYDSYGKSSSKEKPLLLNQIVEFVAVLENSEDDPVVVGQEALLQDPLHHSSSWQDDQPQLPSSTLRLHVVWYRTLDLNLPQNQSQPLPQPFAESAQQPHQLLAQALGVNLVVGAAVSLALLSVAERDAAGKPVPTPYQTTLGCASLNVLLKDTKDCSALQKRLDETLSSVLPHVYSLTVTQESLSSLCIPQKQRGRLVPTPLQFPKGATVILNISQLEPGKLSARQLETMQALQQLVRSHQMPYRFDGGVTIPFEADVRILVLSTPMTHKLLPCTLQVGCASIQTDTVSFPEAQVTTMRHYWNSESRDNSIGLPRSVLDQAQQDFLARRPAITEADFHRWLTVVRLVARGRWVSKHADISDWKRTIEVDDAMVASIPK